MKLFDLLMVINLFVLIINEHVILDEHVEQLAHAAVGVEGERGEGCLVWSLAAVAEHDQEVTH